MTLVVDLDDRQVSHEPVRRGAVPVLLGRLEEHPITGADDLDRPAAPLREPDALEHPDRLAVGVGMPRRACARRTADVAGAHRRAVRRGRDRVQVDRAREPLLRPAIRVDAVPRDLHRNLLAFIVDSSSDSTVMKKHRGRKIDMRARATYALTAGTLLLAAGGAAGSLGPTPPSWVVHGRYSPVINPANFVSRIDNRYFPLRPGTVFRYRGVKDGVEQIDEMVVTHGVKHVLGVKCT